MADILTKVGKIKRVEFPLTIANNGTTISSAFVGLFGILRGLKVKIPDLTSSNTITVSITDEDGKTVYSKASVAENTTTFVFVDANNYALLIPLAGQYKVTVLSSGTETGAKACLVGLYIED